MTLVLAQFIGQTWIDVGPNGETLFCTILQSGQTYCTVQQP